MSKRIVEQIVGVPMPQILEQIVDMPVPQIQEQIVAVVKALFERRAVVQQLLTCDFFFKRGREMERGQGGGSLVRARAAALVDVPRPLPSLSLRTMCRYRHRHERVQARLLFGRDWITQGALLDMIDAQLDSWSWIVLHSTSSTAYISMEEQNSRPHFFGLCSIPKLRILCFSPVPSLALLVGSNDQCDGAPPGVELAA